MQRGTCMSEVDWIERTHDELQYVDNVLADVGTSRSTRGALLKKAAVAAAGASVLGPAGTALAGISRQSGDTVSSVTTTAVTAEALAVTVLTAAVKAAPGSKVAPFIPVLKAANQAEFDHYAALSSLGAKPLTMQFWVPNAALGPG